MHSVSVQKSSPNYFNLLITHTTDSDSPNQVGSIDFIFASGNEIKANFSISDAIRRQSELYDLPEEDLKIIFEKYEVFKSRRA